MMRALSLWQPWASAMARRGRPRKWFETRSWHEGPVSDVAIHASQRWSQELLDIAGRPPFRQMLGVAPTIFTRVKDGPGSLGLPAGAVVCVVDFVRIHRTEDLVARWLSRPSDAALEELAMGNYAPARFAWEARNLRILREPVPLRGRQKLWTLSDDEEQAVRAQIEEAVCVHR